MEVRHEEVKEVEQRIILFCPMSKSLAITYKVWQQ